MPHLGPEANHLMSLAIFIKFAAKPLFAPLAKTSASITCLVILFFGKYIFELFGITLDAFRIGAGALLFLTAVDLVQKEINAEPTCKTDILKHAVVPLAIPVTVGPGTVGALMVMGADMDGVEDLLLGSSALLSAIFSIGLLLYLSGHIERLIGRTGLVVLSKVTGLVLAALSAQLIFTGIKNFLH